MIRRVERLDCTELSPMSIPPTPVKTQRLRISLGDFSKKKKKSAYCCQKGEMCGGEVYKPTEI